MDMYRTKTTKSLNSIELFHTLHKLTNADVQGFLQHVRDVVPLLLFRVVGEHGDEV